MNFFTFVIYTLDYYFLVTFYLHVNSRKSQAPCFHNILSFPGFYFWIDQADQPFADVGNDYSFRYSHLRSGKTDAVFISREGTRLHQRTVRDMVKARGREVLGKHVHPHMLRHTLATELVKGGASLPYVQALLGHADISTTMIYVTLARSDLEEAVVQAHPLVRS